MINTPLNNPAQQKNLHKIKPDNLTHPRIGSKRFSIIPDEIKRRKDLSLSSKVVLGDLIKFAGKNNNAFPKRQTIADSCGISVKMVDKAIRELKEAGIIWVQQRGLRKSNVYYFIEQDWQRASLEANTPPPITEEKSVVEGTLEMPVRVTPIVIDHSNLIHIAGKSQKPVLRDFRKTKQHDIAKKMVDLWVQIVEEGGKAIELGDKLVRYLKQALKDRFGGCLEKWKAFCERVASSKYLMGEKEIKGVWGEKWRASLDWCLKFSNIDKILSGKLYGFGDRVKKPTVAEVKQEAHEMVEEIQKSTEIETVKQARIGLVKALGVASYKSWIKPCAFEVEGDGEININTQSGFRKLYLETHFSDKISEVCRIIFPAVSIGGKKLYKQLIE